MKSVVKSVVPSTISATAGKTVAPAPPTATPPPSNAATTSSQMRTAQGSMVAPPSVLNVETFIDRLMAIGKPNTGISTSISEQDIMDLLLVSKEIFLEQPMMLELGTPLCIVGDIHGQFNDLMRMFSKVG